MEKRQFMKSAQPGPRAGGRLRIVSVLTGPKSDELTIRIRAPCSRSRESASGAVETIRLRAVGPTKIERWSLRNRAFDAIADMIR